MDPLSMEILSQIRRDNALLHSFKGLGDIKLSQNNRRISLRLAVAGIYPDRFRLAIMDISGRVIETFSYDGKFVYLQSPNGSHPFFKKKSNRKIMEKLISIPVLPEDIIGLLAGRPLFGIYDKAMAKILPDSCKQLDLFNGSKQVATILISSDDKISTIEKYEKSSTPLYKVSVLSYASYASFNLPSSFLIENGEGASCRIDLKNYWPNSNPSSDIFTLKDSL
ncbi:MAG: hypothetical protein KJ737_07695 [Proteobacteria bacterium]|nr:hypothetical protein [Pseudomonadota bacterium]